MTRQFQKVLPSCRSASHLEGSHSSRRTHPRSPRRKYLSPFIKDSLGLVNVPGTQNLSKVIFRPIIRDRNRNDLSRPPSFRAKKLSTRLHQVFETPVVLSVWTIHQRFWVDILPLYRLLSSSCHRRVLDYNIWLLNDDQVSWDAMPRCH